MEKFGNHGRFPLVLCASAFCSLTSSYAVLPWVTSSDANGNFSNGVVWSGNGSPVANQSTTTNPDSDVYISQFSGTGLLTLPFAPQARLQENVTASINVTLQGGGSADLVFANRNTFDGGAGTYDGLQFTNFSGNVTGINVDITLSTPVAGRSFTLGGFNALPMISGLAAQSFGTGLNNTSYELGTAYRNIVSAPDTSSAFSLGLQAAFDDPAADEQYNATTGNMSFSAAAFSSVNNFLVVKGYDNSPGQNDYDNSNRQLTYADGQTWSITRDGGEAFVQDANFVLSFDGEQYSNYLDAIAAIPEPSTTGILAFSLLVLVGRRRRN